MRTETFYALVPDSKYLPDGHSTNHGCVEGFSRLVRILDQEIRVTDCKIYEILPPLLGHRHEFIVVAANVDGGCHLIFNCLIMPHVFLAA